MTTYYIYNDGQGNQRRVERTVPFERYETKETAPVGNPYYTAATLVTPSRGPNQRRGDDIFDEDAGTITITWVDLPPPPAPKAMVKFSAFETRFTSDEWNNATDFVEEIDLVTGKPKRRNLKQAMARFYSEGEVDLLAAKTEAFIDILVAAGIVTAERKREILDPNWKPV